MLFPGQVNGQSQEVETGSYIIDMGVTPQGFSNALKPYGLVYALIRDHGVPIIWAINQSKTTRNGIDFSHNGKDYRYGPFIVPKAYRTSAVDALISFWVTTNNGLTVDTTVSDINVSYYKILSFVPIWTLDAQNGKIAEGYLQNAGIPSDGYNWVDPQDLTCCNDLFVMPHADPVWSTHSNLYYWNKDTANGGCRGWIWAACHAVSALENMTDLGNDEGGPYGDTMTNFLTVRPGSSQSALYWSAHDDGDGTYSRSSVDYSVPAEQYVDAIDPATENGSEQVYIPTKQWRRSTTIDYVDANHPQGHNNSSNAEAVKVAYGPAYGNTENGYIMYEAGHSHNKSSGVANVAAQRMFFNFSLESGEAKISQISTSIPDAMVGGSQYQLGSSVVGKNGPYSYYWTAACDGLFDNPYIANPKFTPDSVADTKNCGISLRVIDACGRIAFNSESIVVSAEPQPPVAVKDSAYCFPWLTVTVDPLDNDYDPEGAALTFKPLTPTNTSKGSFTVNGDGTVTYDPLVSFTNGVDSLQYQICDPGNLCDTTWIVIAVNYPDSDDDGINDDVDIDDDNDGIPDLVETGVTGEDPSADKDSDGIPNYADPTPGSGITWVDANSDGINDNFDFDLDGVPDHLDVDADNDGIPDAIEANGGSAPTNYNSTTGRITGSVGANGMPDAVETSSESGVSTYANPDTDGDGNKNFKDIDADNDGITDAIEANGGTPPANYSSTTGTIVITVGDNGWPDSADPSEGGTALSNPDTDSDGIVDYLDIDADNDGIVDNIEGQSTAGYTGPTGNDTDGDGWDDAYDPDNGGTPFSPNNHDGTDNPDYIDTDSDNDSVPDIREGHDADSEGTGDWDTSVENDIVDAAENGGSATTDADNDGLLDLWDPDYISCTYDTIQSQGTDSNDNGGCARIQNTDGTGDRDWRDIDDDDDGILTEDETSDVTGTIGVKDYLETPCSFGEVAQLVNDSIDPTSLSGYINDGSLSNGLTDDGSVTWMEKDYDSLVYTFSSQSQSGSILKLDVDWYGTPDLEVYLSTDGITYTLDDTIPDPTGSTGYEELLVSYTTGSNFSYVKFKVTSSSADWIGFDHVYSVREYTNCVQALSAVDDSSSTLMNMGVNVDIQTNDTNNTATSILDVTVLDSLLNNGSVSVQPDGSVTYTPDNNYTGLDTFYYKLCSEGGMCDTARVIILVQSGPCGPGKRTIATGSSGQGYLFDVIDSTGMTIAGTVYGVPSDQFQHNGYAVDESHSTSTVLTIDMGVAIPQGEVLKIFGHGHYDNGRNVKRNYFSVAESNSPSGPFTTTDTFMFLTQHQYESFSYAIDGSSGARYFKLLYLFNMPDQEDWIGFQGFSYDFNTSVLGCYNPPPLAVNDTTTTYFETSVNFDISTNDVDSLGDTLTYNATPLVDVQNGSVSINTDGTVTYTPADDFTGTDSFKYEVCDTVPSPDKGCDTAWAFITVTHNPPVATNDFDTTESGVPTTLNILNNDSEPESQSLALTIGTSTTGGGTISTGGNGQITYTPPSNFVGEDSIEYIICDGQTPNKCDTAKVYFHVDTYVNNPPVAVVDSAVTELNEPIDIESISNDYDLDDDNLKLLSAGTDGKNASTGAGGTITLYGDGAVEYCPSLGFVGIDSFLYIIEDEDGAQDTAWDFIIVSAKLNDPPVANNDYMNAYWDPAGSGSGVQTTVQPFVNDYDIDSTLDSSAYHSVNNIPGVEVITQPTRTNIDITWTPSTGLFTYETDASIVDGTLDSFQYKVCDQGTPLPALCDTAWVYVMMYNGNVAPVANLDRDTTYVNQDVFVNIKRNDSDPENASNNEYEIPVAGEPKNGTATITASNKLKYEPNPGFVGNDTMYYRLCDDGGAIEQCDTALVIITVLNNDVIATFDESSTLLNASTTIDIRINDLDPDGHEFWISDLAPTSSFSSGDTSGANTALGGSVSINVNGTPNDPTDDYIDYTPPTNISGVDTFWYTACDTVSSPQTGCDETYVLITIQENGKPVAVDDQDSTPINTAVIVDVLYNDYDLTGSLNPSTVDTTNGGGPSNGLITFNASTGEITYTPNNGFLGLDTFEYYVCDAITPSKCDTAIVVITVYDQFTVAIHDDNSTYVETPVSGNVTTNDFDPEGDIQTFNSFLNQNGNGSAIASGNTISGLDTSGASVSNAGTLTFAADGSYTFTPASGFIGVVTIPYGICDDGYPSACDTAELVIDVSPFGDPTNPNDNGVFANDDDGVSYGGLISSNLLANDGDPEQDSIYASEFTYDSDGDGIPETSGTFNSATAVGGIDNYGNNISNAGSINIDQNGDYTFTPSNGFEGQVWIDYVTCDTVTTNQACDPATLHLTVYSNVSGTNNPPFAGDDFSFTNMNTPVSGLWSENDIEPNGDSIRLSLSEQYIFMPNASLNTKTIMDSLITNQGGKVIMYSDGSYTYTPPSDYAGPDFAKYAICDKSFNEPQPLCDSATIYLLVGSMIADYGDLPTNIYDDAWNIYADKDQNGIPEGNLPIWLGQFITDETSTRHSSDASSDVDDGLIFPPTLDSVSTNTFKVIVNSTVSSTTVYFKLWIDWDKDGTFDETHSGSGVTGSPDTIDVNVDLPTGEDGSFFTRLRVALNADDLVPNGEMLNGETEDYFTNMQPLPVELLHFDAQKEGNKVLLTWTTASELNNSHFEVERRNDANDWVSIGRVDGQGTTVSITDYQFYDEKPMSGLSYYRLKQVDFDEKFDYSEVKLVEFGGIESWSLYPNPTRSNVTIQFDPKMKGEIKLRVINSKGQELISNTEFLTGGKHSVGLSLRDFPKGIYMILVQSGNQTRNFAVLRQ